MPFGVLLFSLRILMPQSSEESFLSTHFCDQPACHWAFFVSSTINTPPRFAAQPRPWFVLQLHQVILPLNVRAIWGVHMIHIDSSSKSQFSPWRIQPRWYLILLGKRLIRDPEIFFRSHASMHLWSCEYVLMLSSSIYPLTVLLQDCFDVGHVPKSVWC